MKNHLLEKLHPNLRSGGKKPQKPNRKNFTGLLRSVGKKFKKNRNQFFFLLLVAHLANGAPLLSLIFFHFPPLDLKSPVSSVLLGFWGF